MYPTTVEQSRQESLHPQTVHLHMHQLCTCVHPYYTGYRPPPLLASPFPVQPIPRPYNLQHYQYTQFNVSPYTFPLTPMSQTPSPTATPLDRRSTFDSGETIPDAVGDASKETRDLLLGLEGLQFQETLPPPSENFTRFLEQGCVLAEKIAIRNQHRPCFKNIQNLCNRTRGEILKPSNTVSNIHSQGIPWATKDFIYAFVRLINCWHMLKGYLDSKDGTLGNIDKELTPDFKACYLAWEKDTKELSAHMVRIFSNLDNHVSNPTPSASSFVLRSSKVVVQTPQKVPQPAMPPKDSPKSVRGILHLPPAQTEVVETVIFSESTNTSPREEDSDNESRVYMKPGSYNVPKKANSSNNSSPSIEFFDTAQNVSAHYKKLAKKKSSDVVLANNEKMWQDAQSAVPYLLNKINPPQDALVCDETDDALKYFIDLNTLDQGSDIQEWLNNSNFVENASCDLNESQPATPTFQDGFLSKTVTLLQRQSSKSALNDPTNDLLINSLKNYQLTNISPPTTVLETKNFPKKEKTTPIKPLAMIKKISNAWENEKGGLAANTYLLLEKITKTLESHELVQHFPKKPLKFQEDADLRNPLSLELINKKLKARKYQFLNEFVHDFRHIFATAESCYDDEILPKVKDFADKFEEELDRYFPSVDFSAITGDRNEDVTYLVLKRSRKEGDGDH